MSQFNELNLAVRKYQHMLLADPYRPKYHFAFPYGNGWPGDANGAFFADGVYHVMFLYVVEREDGVETAHWGHISSRDLLHWRQHPDALTVEDGDMGCYSGGAFVDDDGTAYLSFWKFPSPVDKENGDNGGIMLARSTAPYDHWERMRPLAIEGSRDPWGTMELEVNGQMEHIACADPSNIWKLDGWYYMQTGNKCVMDNWAREGEKGPIFDSKYAGDWVDLFRSKDLKTWSYVHRFYQNDHTNPEWPDETEDDMCPVFLPIYDAKENGKPTGKCIQIFISHNRGCQYYVGTLKEETFYPEVHGRMSWKDKVYFAPEALVDDRNRLLLWTWIVDNRWKEYDKYGWAGIFGFPRVLWWEDEELHMAPAQELDQLQYHHHVPDITESGKVCVRNGEAFRMKAVIDMKNQEKAGFCVRTSSDEETSTPIYYDKKAGVLVMDTTNSGNEGWRRKEEAPFTLREGELLSLDIFVDQAVVEVYANERQAISRRVYPENPVDAVGVTLIGSVEDIVSLNAWEMDVANQY